MTFKINILFIFYKDMYLLKISFLSLKRYTEPYVTLKWFSLEGTLLTPRNARNQLNSK